MRIGIVSDIHGNIAGLDRALAEMNGIDELICAGDSIYQFRFSNEVVNRLRERNALAIKGNHEEVFFSRDGERARAAPWIDREALAWLDKQPASLTLTRSGRRILVVHGSPWEPRYEYIYPNSPTLRRFAMLDVDIVILGHTHYRMAERIGHVLVINPGSAGEPRDPRNGYQLSCAVLDPATEEVTFFDYPDPTRVVATTPELTMGHWQTPGVTGYGYERAPSVKRGERDPWAASLDT